MRDSKTPTSRSIRSLNGHITSEPEDIKKCLEKCVASLFYDDKGEIDDGKIVLYDSGPSILKEEVQWALQNSKTGKAASRNEVVVEKLIVLQEDGVDLLWKLFNKIYETGQILIEIHTIVVSTMKCFRERLGNFSKAQKARCNAAFSKETNSTEIKAFFG